MPLRVVSFVAARGHDAEALCRGVGIHLASLKEEGARVPYIVAEELGLRAAESRSAAAKVTMVDDAYWRRDRVVRDRDTGRVLPT